MALNVSTYKFFLSKLLQKFYVCFFITSILLLNTNYSILSAQTILPQAESAFDTQLPFNAEYIKTQKIKSIAFDIIDKKDLEVAVDKGLINYYEFNASGNLARFYYTTVSKIIQKEYHTEPRYHRKKLVSSGHSYTKSEYLYDTTSTNYFYNEDKTLKLKRYKDGDFYESYYYEYNNQKVSKENRCKETNVSEIKTEFKLGNQLPISDESYVYQQTGKNQLKKVCQNNEGRPYKEVIYNYSPTQQIVSINEQYIVAWIIQQNSFEYNAKGQLTKAIYKSNSNGDLEKSIAYEYDANDCLLTEKQYKNGIKLKEISYITDSTKKLTSYIIREADKKTIRIVKLIYSYF